MVMLSKFDGACKVCKIKIPKGTPIQKTSGHWCIYPNCGHPGGPGPDIYTDAPQTQTPPTPAPQQTPPASETPDQFFKRRQQEIAKTMQIPDDVLNDTERALIRARTMKMYAVNQVVSSTMQEMGDTSPNGAMVGQFTKIIMDELEKSN